MSMFMKSTIMQKLYIGMKYLILKVTMIIIIQMMRKRNIHTFMKMITTMGMRRNIIILLKLPIIYWDSIPFNNKTLKSKAKTTQEIMTMVVFSIWRQERELLAQGKKSRLLFWSNSLSLQTQAQEVNFNQIKIRCWRCQDKPLKTD